MAAEQSSIIPILIRPIPAPSAWAAITTHAFLTVCLPVAPSSSPPTSVSVHLHPPVQPIPVRSYHRTSQFMQPGPRRLITGQAQHALQPQGAGPVLLTGHIPHRAEPHDQRLPSVLENGARSSRGLTPAAAALKQGGTNQNRLGPLTLRAPKSVRPSQAYQVGPTAFFRREATLELLNSTRIVLHS